MKKDTIKKAGAIIMSHDLKSIALVYRPTKNDWTFPKGHIGEGETEVMAMYREVAEETGMDVEVIKHLPDMVYVDGNGKNICVRMFLAIFIKAKIGEKTGNEQVKWTSIDEVAQKLSYPNLREYFSSVLVVIKNSIL